MGYGTWNMENGTCNMANGHGTWTLNIEMEK
jgi:hypothetical protein